jgi:alkylhydroperoxidase family enzyme
MSEATARFRQKVVDRVLSGDGVASTSARRAAFDNRDVEPRPRALVDKVARHAWKVTAQDVETSRAAGVSEDEIFELVVCAALGQATRQLDAALAALHAATGQSRRNDR